MGNSRMFCKDILWSTKFLKMTPQAQILYVQMCMNGDDDGVVEAFQVKRLLAVDNKFIKQLIDHEFITLLDSENDIYFINHWSIHNYIRADRKKDTEYKDLLVKIKPDWKPSDNQMSGKCQADVRQMTDKCQTNDNQMSGKCQADDGQLVENCQHKRREEKIREENIKEKNIKEKSAKGCTPIVFIENFSANDFSHLSDKTFYDTFVDYLNERINRKRPASKNAQKNMLIKLQEHDLETAIKMLRRSIMNGWIGLFELPQPQQNFNTGNKNENNTNNNPAFAGNAKQKPRDVFDKVFGDVTIDGYLATVAEAEYSDESTN